MITLEDLKPDAPIHGVTTSHSVRIASVEWIGNHAMTLVYRKPDDEVAESTLSCDGDGHFAIEARGRGRSSDGVGGKVHISTQEEIDLGWQPEADRHLVHEFEQSAGQAIVLILQRIGPNYADSAKFPARCLCNISGNKRRDTGEAASCKSLIAVRSELTAGCFHPRNTWQPKAFAGPVAT